ncbi:GNAT family N-acetyltransferase [Marivirga arenosa]|uniref:GNAT family N-acetyltransferase n=1 Tax=Marivirga arenosa TaxID=3059076 RepID=A0AA49JCP5_9BACT|nr:GNAT family N-acetyltransferase [Marivirga sp. BKB1-2]WKK81035.1 GNAT family N-acetyltransferase [Marivirga sp. BKB1-2]
MLNLRSTIDANYKIIEFFDVANQNIEMLYINPEHRGKRIGKTLLEYVINHLRVSKVDVNEQNGHAEGFYKHCGFETIRRSELDVSGKPYPILHVKLIK